MREMITSNLRRLRNFHRKMERRANFKRNRDEILRSGKPSGAFVSSTTSKREGNVNNFSESLFPSVVIMNNLWLLRRRVIMTTKSLYFTSAPSRNGSSVCNCFSSTRPAIREGEKYAKEEKLIKYLLSSRLCFAPTSTRPMNN